MLQTIEEALLLYGHISIEDLIPIIRMMTGVPKSYLEHDHELRKRLRDVWMEAYPQKEIVDAKIVHSGSNFQKGSSQYLANCCFMYWGQPHGGDLTDLTSKWQSKELTIKRVATYFIDEFKLYGNKCKELASSKDAGAAPDEATVAAVAKTIMGPDSPCPNFKLFLEKFKTMGIKNGRRKLNPDSSVVAVVNVLTHWVTNSKISELPGQFSIGSVISVLGRKNLFTYFEDIGITTRYEKFLDHSSALALKYQIPYDLLVYCNVDPILEQVDRILNKIGSSFENVDFDRDSTTSHRIR
jgi:hypothetical protein